MDTLDIFNTIALRMRPAHNPFTPVQAIPDSWVEANMDSMDVMLMVMYYSIVYNVPDAVADTYVPKSPKDLIHMVSVHGTYTEEQQQMALGDL